MPRPSRRPLGLTAVAGEPALFRRPADAAECGPQAAPSAVRRVRRMRGPQPAPSTVRRVRRTRGPQAAPSTVRRVRRTCGPQPAGLHRPASAADARAAAGGPPPSGECGGCASRSRRASTVRRVRRTCGPQAAASTVRRMRRSRPGAFQNSPRSRENAETFAASLPWPPRVRASDATAWPNAVAGAAAWPSMSAF